MAFVLNTLVDGTKILASKLNENFEGLQGDIVDNYTELDGRLDTFDSTLSNIQDNLSAVASVPTGTVFWFADDSAPTGYLICNGSAVSRTEYADLFAVIGTTFGTGNGETTFNVPNLVDKFIEGSTTVGTSIAAGLPNITGGFSGDFGQYTYGVFYNNGWAANNTGDGDGNLISFDASRSSTIYGNSETVQPPALTLLPCIKY